MKEQQTASEPGAGEIYIKHWNKNYGTDYGEGKAPHYAIAAMEEYANLKASPQRHQNESQTGEEKFFSREDMLKAILLGRSSKVKHDENGNDICVPDFPPSMVIDSIEKETREFKKKDSQILIDWQAMKVEYNTWLNRTNPVVLRDWEDIFRWFKSKITTQGGYSEADMRKCFEAGRNYQREFTTPEINYPDFDDYLNQKGKKTS